MSRASERRTAAGVRAAGPALLLAAVLAAGCGGGPPPDLGGAPGRAQLDAWLTMSQDSTGVVRPSVVVAVPQAQLVFQSDGDGYRAGLEVRVVARRGGRQAGGGVARGEVSVASFAATRSRAPLEVTVPLLVRGEEPVSLEVTAQALATTRTWRRTLAFTPRALAALPVWIAGLRTNLAPAPDGGLLVDAALDSVRLEVRLQRQRPGPPWPDGGIELVGEIAGPALAEPQRQRQPVPASADTALVTELRQVWPVDRLPFGRWRLGVQLEAAHEGQRWRLPREPALSVVNLRVPVRQDRDWRRHVGWLEGLLSAAARDSLRAVGADGRAAAWADAWRRIAAAQDGAPAEAERRHLLRIVAADDRFGGFGRGSLSDRGRVFIRWGEPAHIDIFLDERMFGAVYEVWIHPAAGLRFVFHDAHGTGDFRLRQTEPLDR